MLQPLWNVKYRIIMYRNNWTSQCFSVKHLPNVTISLRFSSHLQRPNKGDSTLAGREPEAIPFGVYENNTMALTV